VRQVSARTALLQPSEEHKDECARLLRHHFETGYLDARDLELRLELLDRALTLGELRRLTADLPEAGRRLRLPALLRR
jgi:hypothetical protein